MSLLLSRTIMLSCRAAAVLHTRSSAGLHALGRCLKALALAPNGWSDAPDVAGPDRLLSFQ